METKNKIMKIGKTCGIISKVLYCLACVSCLTFIALAIALSCTNAIKELSVGETAIVFSTLALYSFVCIGLLWNVEHIFTSMLKNQTPFCEKVIHYLKKTGVFVILIATIPAIIGNILLHSIIPETELNFSVELGGIIAGIVLILLCLFFEYGKELENK